MPRLSLWKDGKHSNDYKFMDRRISEMFTVGGTGVYVHKYIGTKDQGDKDDATQPKYLNQSEQNIQDLLFVENRDRKYEDDVYDLRGHYTRGDNDFNLSQFGIFLSGDTIIVTFHINDMVNTLGRRIMSGDVIELPHLKDFDSLDQNVPAALKRFYVAGDASFASEGFTPTWWPHLWRVKFEPLVDAQEYKDIINKITVSEDSNTPIAQILSTYDKSIAINDAVIAQAVAEVPKSGYDVSNLFEPKLPVPGKSNDAPSADDVGVSAGDENLTAADDTATAQNTETHVTGWLTGDTFGEHTGSGTSFPIGPSIGDMFLRLDYLPNRMFKYDGSRWVKQTDAVRSGLTPNTPENTTSRDNWSDTTETYIDPANPDNTVPVRQSLSKAFTPKADNNG
jgi:hypothetical protein